MCRINSKMLVGLIVVVLANSSSAIGQTMEEAIADLVCDCFNSTNASIDEFMKNKMDSCFYASFESRKNELVTQFKIDSMKSNSEAYALGHDMGKKMVPQLIYRCDKFFTDFEELKKSFFGNVDRKTELMNLQDANTFVKLDPSAENYLSRAISYYKLGDSKSALKDVSHMLQLNQNYAQAYLLRGMIMDNKGKYDEAIADFQKCKSISQRIEFDCFIAISERKKKKKLK